MSAGRSVEEARGAVGGCGRHYVKVGLCQSLSVCLPPSLYQYISKLHQLASVHDLHDFWRQYAFVHTYT